MQLPIYICVHCALHTLEKNLTHMRHYENITY